MDKIKLSDSFNYKRLLRFTMPSIAMMIFTSIYGVVDGFFVSNFAGKTPFAGVNLIFPFLIILGTVGFMFGTGGTAVVAKIMGEGDEEKAKSLFSLFVYFTFVMGMLFAVFGIVFIKPIARLLGAEGDLLYYAVLYGRIILCALPFFVLQMLFQSFFVTAEKANLGFIVTIIAGVTNMVLDAVLVVFLPQEYKLIGAALATACSQLVGGIIPVIYFFSKNDSRLRLGKTKFDGKAIINACFNGSSEFMANVAMSLVGMLYNVQLMKYAGENGIASYGVMMYVSMIFSAIFFGYSVGIAPVIAFHYGAKNNNELKSLLKKSVLIILISSVLMVILAEVLAYPLAKLFVGYNDDLVSLTLSGFRTFSFCFLFMGFAIFASGFFTALSDGLTSALISFLRTAIFQVLAVILLPLVLGVNGIWLSVIVAEFMAVTLSILFLIIKKKRFGY